MLEIIIVLYLARRIGGIAESKGYHPRKWKGYVWLAWFVSEVAVLLLGTVLFGYPFPVWIYLLAIASAVTGYFLVLQKVKQLPAMDNPDDWINHIGNNDL
jgi:hypothetical protein